MRRGPDAAVVSAVSVGVARSSELPDLCPALATPGCRRRRPWPAGCRRPRCRTAAGCRRRRVTRRGTARSAPAGAGRPRPLPGRCGTEREADLDVVGAVEGAADHLVYDERGLDRLPRRPGGVKVLGPASRRVRAGDGEGCSGSGRLEAADNNRDRQRLRLAGAPLVLDVAEQVIEGVVGSSTAATCAPLAKASSVPDPVVQAPRRTVAMASAPQPTDRTSSSSPGRGGSIATGR